MKLWYSVHYGSCLQCHTGGNHVRPMHPSVGSSGLGTSCSPSPPKSVLSQSAPADVNAFTYLYGDIDATDGAGNTQVNTALLYQAATQCV